MVQTSQPKRRGGPNPPPRRPTCSRLEHVRKHFGFSSLRSFWRALTEGWEHGDPVFGNPVSYEAVRNYHWNREASARYHARVAHVFSDVRLEWLITGEGEMLESEQAKRRYLTRDLLRRVSERHLFLGGLQRTVQESFVDLLLAYQFQVPGGRYLEKVDDGEQLQDDLADDLVFLLTLPLRAWGFHAYPPPGATTEEVATGRFSFQTDDFGPMEEARFETLSRVNFERYFGDMLAALAAIVKFPNRGYQLVQLPNSLVPRLRRLVDGEDATASREKASRARAIQAQLDQIKGESWTAAAEE